MPEQLEDPNARLLLSLEIKKGQYIRIAKYLGMVRFDIREQTIMMGPKNARKLARILFEAADLVEKCSQDSGREEATEA